MITRRLVKLKLARGGTSGAVFSQLHQKIWSPSVIGPATCGLELIPVYVRPALSLKEQGVL